MNTTLKVIIASVALAITADAFAEGSAGIVVQNTLQLENGNSVEVVRRGRVDEEGNKRISSAYRLTDGDGERIAAGVSRGRTDADGNASRTSHRVRQNVNGTVTRKHVRMHADDDTVTRRARATRR